MRLNFFCGKFKRFKFFWSEKFQFDSKFAYHIIWITHISYSIFEKKNWLFEVKMYAVKFSYGVK
jgi:hypothetical protein